MKDIYLVATNDSPKVIMDYEKGFIEFEGECYPENTFEFFEPILECLKKFLLASKEKAIEINFKLTYFNSATTQILFDIFDELEENNNQLLSINWFYNDKSTLRDYEEFHDEFASLNINAIEK